MQTETSTCIASPKSAPFVFVCFPKMCSSRFQRDTQKMPIARAPDIWFAEFRLSFTPVLILEEFVLNF